MSSALEAHDWLRLTLADGVGPVLGRRLVAAFGNAASLFDATPADLERVRGIGQTKARTIAASLRQSAPRLEQELALAARLGVRFIGLHDPAYPPLLAQCPDAPLVLSVRGADPCPAGSFPLAIVGSRHCTAYGVEQAERFASTLAQNGLVIVSGGARGIDTASHRAALRVSGITVAVLGCGLAQSYPPENADLFNQIVDRGGSVVSELPLTTSPAPENFPARNRIIVGLSLGVFVIEAPEGSGSLITARIALDDYGREVMALPGRVDSRASAGSNLLLKSGEAALVTAPADVLATLESAARHLHFGTHEPRFATPHTDAEADDESAAAPDTALPPTRTLAPASHARRPQDQAPPPGSKGSGPTPNTLTAALALTPNQRRIVDALTQDLAVQDLVVTTGLDVSTILAEALVLEVRGVISRTGSVYRRGDLGQPSA